MTDPGLQIIRPETCEWLEQRWLDYFTNDYRAGNSRPAGNRSSTLCHPCGNYTLLSRRFWESRKRPSPHLCSIFRQGNVMELDSKRLLQHEMTVPMSMPDTDLWDDQYQISGHIDCVVEIPEGRFLGEIKSMNPNTFDRIHRAADLLEQSFHVFRSYVDQVLLYLYLRSEPKGLLIPRCKNDSRLRFLWVYLDSDDNLDRATRLLEKAERVNAAFADGVEHIDKLCSPQVCPECEWWDRCAPPLSFAPALIAQNPEFIAMVDERMAYEEAGRLFAEADKSVKDALKRVEWGDSDRLQAGRWEVRRKVASNGAQRFSFSDMDSTEPKGDDDDAG
jgi:hypothetical protein